jgi:DNA-binding NtrC family response regulator
MNLESSQQQVQLPYVLVVFPCDENRGALLKVIAQAGKVPLLCDTFEEAQEAVMHQDIRTIVCGDALPEKGLEAFLDLARNRTRPVPVIVASRTGGWREFLKALGQGVFDYLVLPPQLDEVRRVLGLAFAEGSRTGADETRSGEAPISEANPPVYRFDDRRPVRFSEAAPVLSLPLIPRA